ncbi:hypothetical protein ACHMW6_06075 [Pseudoduganella sp. UC29_106]|uniref:hypothetical protein n=1 Tax=Pseudoduganella sp. UC29_106 TaxID=3374553 RepID=UPI003757DC35
MNNEELQKLKDAKNRIACYIDPREAPHDDIEFVLSSIPKLIARIDELDTPFCVKCGGTEICNASALDEATKPFEQDDEYKAFIAAHRAQVMKTVKEPSEEMVLWHASRHWDGKPGEMWRARAALAAEKSLAAPTTQPIPTPTEPYFVGLLNAQYAIVGRTSDGRDIDLPVFGDGSKDGKTLLLVSLPDPAPTAMQPVAVVDANDDGMWADILPNVTVKVGQPLYAAAQAPAQADSRDAVLPADVIAWLDAETARIAAVHEYNAAIEAAKRFGWPGPDTNPQYQKMNTAGNAAHKLIHPAYEALIAYRAAMSTTGDAAIGEKGNG